MIDIPKDVRSAVFLQSIKVRDAYLDKKSREKHTGVLKKKYKVAGHSLPKELGQYAFFVPTTKKEACGHSTTVEVAMHDWETRQGRYLDKTSYIDISKTEFLSKKELLDKIVSSADDFKRVGVLSQKKFDELSQLKERVPSLYSKTTLATRQKIVQALQDASIERCDIVLARLGLSSGD